jgi:hypothetical protein
MYCPNCGQQQVSNEMRFCSRCGLALSGLADWLAGGRPVATQTLETLAAKQPLSPRRKGIRRAGKLMFFSGAIFPIFLMISIAEGEPGPLLVPFFLFFIALAWMLYARLFSDPNPKVDYQQTAQPPRLVSMPTHSALPPAATIPISDMRGSQVRTNELAQPPSVTEQTTRFLDKE